MTTWLEIQRVVSTERRNITPDGRVGIVEGACPGCKAEPFRVQGRPVPQDDPKIVKAGGHCVDCGDAVGFVFWDRDEADRDETLFGREEDDAMTKLARARVYGMDVPR